MALAIMFLPLTPWTLGAIFIVGGVYVAIEETLEDSFCAELVGEEHHGMAFGTLATVNGVGDFLSSLIVGALWTAFGTSVAFGYSAVLFLAGAVLVGQLRPSSPTGLAPAEGPVNGR
jgi:MFS family permease